jgi:hypothetical protein
MKIIVHKNLGRMRGTKSMQVYGSVWSAKGIFNLRSLVRFNEFSFIDQHKIHLNLRTWGVREMLHKPSLKEEERKRGVRGGSAEPRVQSSLS